MLRGRSHRCQRTRQTLLLKPYWAGRADVVCLVRFYDRIVDQSFLCYTIVCHYVSPWWSDVLDCALEVGDDRSLQECKVCYDFLREILCEVILVGFVFVLFSFCGFVEKYLLSLALHLVLCCF
jgi:hypothetical protein